MTINDLKKATAKDLYLHYEQCLQHIHDGSHTEIEEEALAIELYDRAERSGTTPALLAACMHGDWYARSTNELNNHTAATEATA